MNVWIVYYGTTNIEAQYRSTSNRLFSSKDEADKFVNRIKEAIRLLSISDIYYVDSPFERKLDE